MSELCEPCPVKFFTGIIHSKNFPLDQCISALEKEFGKKDFISDKYTFDFTNYYEKEMGKHLSRIFISFRSLIKRDRLVEIKLVTNKLEKDFSIDGRRRINIDPGYLAQEHLILATGKGYYHRPHLGKGVYADLTLIYRNKEFRPLEWTYPDYRTETVRDFFKMLREKYVLELEREIK